MKKILIVLLSMLVFIGCQSASELNEVVEGDEKIVVVTTVGMLGDMLENIAGDLVEVESLMGPGVDPHLYKASAGDIAKMENADIVFYVGFHLEGKMVEIFESLSKTKAVYALAENLEENVFLDPQVGQTGSHDPHIWFDVELWSQTIAVVRDALIEVDPVNVEFYTANAADYFERLLELDLWVQEQINLIPDDQKIMITAHDAFNYFAAAYGIRVEGLQGISTASEYGLKDLEKIIDLILENKVKAVFVESSVPRKSIEALQEGVIAEGWQLEIGGELFSDGMGDPSTPEGSYIGMVQHNVNTIVNSLK